MIGKKVIESKPVTLAEVVDILEKRASAGDIGFEQQASLDYARKFAKVSREKAEEIVRKLCENEKIKRETAVKIVDIMPKYKSQLLVILAKERCELSENEIDEVFKILQG